NGITARIDDAMRALASKPVPGDASRSASRLSRDRLESRPAPDLGDDSVFAATIAWAISIARCARSVNLLELFNPDRVARRPAVEIAQAALPNSIDRSTRDRASIARDNSRISRDTRPPASALTIVRCHAFA